MATLTEIQPFQCDILESKKREGILMTLEGVVQRADTQNANKRIYPLSLWQNIMQDEDVTERIKSGRMVGHLDHPSCLTSNDFKVLTLDGWKDFKDISVGDKVWSFDGGEAVVSEVQKIIDEPYDGDAYVVKNQFMNSGFTPNHRFLTIKRPYQNKKNKITYVTAEELHKDEGYYAHFGVPKTANFKNQESVEHFIIPGVGTEGKTKNDVTKDLKIESELFAAFMGIYLAEGGTYPDNGECNYGVFISQTTPWSKKIIYDEILSKFPEELKWKDDKKGFHVADKRLWAYLKNLGNMYTKYIPREIKNLSKECLKELIFWFGIGDGRMVHSSAKTRTDMDEGQTTKEALFEQFREGHVPYTRKDVFSVSERLVRDLHECLVRSGGSGTISEIVTEEDYKFDDTRDIKAENKVPLWQLHISSTNHMYLRPQFYKPEKIHHEGNVYCLQVTHGNFYMEQNGKAFWTGNSGATSIDQISHKMTEQKLMPNGEVRGQLDILDTPAGRIAETLFKAGVQLGISSRGDGSVEQKGDISEVQDDFKLETYDLVLKPSTPGAYPQIIESEEKAKENTILIADAVEGLVKSTSNVDTLLECHKIISVLEDRNRANNILKELKTKLNENPTVVEHVIKPSTEENTHMSEQVSTPSPETVNFIENQIKLGIEKQLKEKDEEINKINAFVANITTQKEDTEEKLQAAEKIIEEFQRKTKELQETNTIDEELTQKYDASVKLLDEALSRLQDQAITERRLDAAQKLLSASLDRHHEESVRNTVTDLLSGIDEDIASKVKPLLLECEAPEDVKARYEELSSLVESVTTSPHIVHEPLPTSENEPKSIVENKAPTKKPFNNSVLGLLDSKIAGRSVA